MVFEASRPPTTIALSPAAEHEICDWPAEPRAAAALPITYRNRASLRIPADRPFVFVISDTTTPSGFLIPAKCFRYKFKDSLLSILFALLLFFD